MKLRKFFLAILVFCLACPLTVHAKTYTMSNTDISISVDDSSWYVFTRDNLLNNSELKELGIASNEMRDILEGNMAYMDALLIYEDGDFVELLIRKTKIEDSFTNLSNYSNEQVLELAELLGEKHNTKNYSVYENQYKFVKLEYFDSTYDYYIYEFLTMVNKDNYTLTFQSPSPFTKSERDEIQNIVDSIKFDVDSSLEELIPTVSVEQNTPSILDQAVETGITGAISGGLLAIMALLFGKIKKARKIKKKDNVPDNIPELKKFWYEKECVFVEFQSGRITKYIDVPDKMYFAMCNVPKKSKYLFEYIEGNFVAEDVKKADSEKSPEVELNNYVAQEKLECQPEAINEENISCSQESPVQKKVEDDKCFDDIKKYKELLDLGIITQEEFNAKKKELLGL